MRSELARLQRIERHLLDQPPPADAPAWEIQLLLDPELAADTALQHSLYQGLQLAGQRQLRRELQAIHHRLYGNGQISWWRNAEVSLRTALSSWTRRRKQ